MNERLVVLMIKYFRIECPLIFLPDSTLIILLEYNIANVIQTYLSFINSKTSKFFYFLTNLENLNQFIHILLAYFTKCSFVWVYCMKQWDIDGRSGIIDEWEKHMIKANRCYQKSQIGELQSFGNHIWYHISKTNIRPRDQSRLILYEWIIIIQLLFDYFLGNIVSKFVRK